MPPGLNLLATIPQQSSCCPVYSSFIPQHSVSTRIFTLTLNTHTTLSTPPTLCSFGSHGHIVSILILKHAEINTSHELIPHMCGDSPNVVMLGVLESRYGMPHKWSTTLGVHTPSILHGVPLWSSLPILLSCGFIPQAIPNPITLVCVS